MKILATLVATVMLLLSTACAVEDDADAADPADALADNNPAATADPNDYGLTEDTLNETFTAYVRSEFPHVYGADTDEDIILLGHTVCDALDSGMTFYEVVVAAEPSDPMAMAGLGGAAIGAYCPEHEGALDE